MNDIASSPTDKLTSAFWSKLIDSEREFLDEAYFNPSESLTFHSRSLFLTPDVNATVEKIAPSEFLKFIFFLGILKSTYSRFFSKPNVIVFSNTFSGLEHLGKLIFSKTTVSQETTAQQLLIQLAQHFNELQSMDNFDVWNYLSESNLTKTYQVNENNFNLLMTCNGKNDYHSMAQFFLAVNLVKESSSGEFYLEFKSSMDEVLLEQFVQSYETMVGSFVNDTNMSIAKMNMISPAQEKLTEQLSSLDLAVKAEKSVMEMVESNVLLHPMKGAVVFNDIIITYKELDVMVNQLTNTLCGNAKDLRGERIGVSLSRSHKSIIAMLAVFKSGACYIPLDRTLPPARLKYLINDVQPTSIIVEHITENVFQPFDIPMINLDKSDFSGAGKTFELQAYHQDEDAYIVYTSGSTGQPKGIRQTYKTLSNLTEWQIKYSGIESGLRFLQYASFTFDVSIQDTWYVLASGGELHVTSDDIRLDFDALKEYILKQKIEILFFPYSVLGNFFNTNDTEKLSGNKLRHIISGSEQVFIGDGLEQFLRHNPTIKLHNQYGPSETHVVTSFTLDATNIINRMPIGKPISNTHIYILDENLRPVPVGVIGEIYVGGYNLANGYWNLAKTTADSFLNLEIYGRNEKTYRTGDFAKWLPDGNIAYLGRGDDQVKIRGFRIELSEISRYILQQPGVRESVVVIYENANAQKQIVAFVIPGVEFDLSDLERQIQSHFPEYMVPHHIISMDRFPLTPNGKLDKRKLKTEIDAFNADIVNASASAPVSRLEQELLELWRSNLNNDAIGTNGDFFKLGGDSMRVIRLVGKIKSTLEFPIHVKDIYQFPTVKSLAKKIQEIEARPVNSNDDYFEQTMAAFKQLVLTEDATVKRLPTSYEDFYPIADIQFGMLFHSWKEAELSLYHDQNINYIDDLNFDPALFRVALGKIIKKHEMLRTSFMVEEFTIPIQVVHLHSEEKAPVEYVDLSRLSQKEREAYLFTFAQDDLKQKFDITSPGLFRITVFKLNERTYGILISNHHAILDGWSYASLLTELSNVYFNLKEIPDFSPGRLKTSYKDFIKSQFENSSDEQVKDFWKNYLRGCERTALPFNANLKLTSKGVQNTPIVIGEDLCKKIKAYSDKYGYSFKEIFLSVFLVVVKLTTNSKEVTVGLVSNARHEEEDADKVLGCFLNTIPFRFAQDSGIDGHRLITKVHEELIRVKSFDKLSLSEISKVCGNVSVDGNPFYDLVFDYVDFHIYSQVHQETVLSNADIQLGNEKPNGVLELQVQNHSGAFKPWWIYRDNVFNDEQLSRLSHYVVNTLELITRENGEIDTDKLLTQDERDIMKSLAFDQLDVSYPDDWSLIDAFKKSATDNPGGVAVKFSGRSLSYAELDSLSERVAVELQNQFLIKPNDFVGLMMPRSEWLIVGILGILKSGAAYVPIDLKYPQERKEYILQKTDLRIIISGQDSQSIGWDSSKDVVLFNITKLLETETDKKILHPKLQTRPDDIAYVIFTSGSSGKPKGVKVTHRNAVRLFLNNNSPFDFTMSDRWLCFHSECFDFSVWEIFGPLTSGATLVIASSEEIYSIDDFLRVLVDEKITILSQTPTAFTNWISEARNMPDFKNNQVRYIVFGGEALNPSILSIWRQISPATKLINMYGITETTVHVTYKEVLPKEIENGVTTAGRPLPTLGVLILDEDGKMVPMGTVGEIAVLGAGVASGYLGDEELTSKKFITSHYWKKGRCYLSGDMARLLDNNEIEYIGRKDHQVKIRGYRIELQEIEIPLNNHPEIEVAKVIVADNGGHKALIAYYVSKTGNDVTQLFSYLRNYIPAYMIPSKYFRVERFKFNENGKLDTSLLTKGADTNLAPRSAPQGARELELEQIWKQLINVSMVHSDDNFFEIGGNSLKAAQLVLKVRQQMGMALTIREAFEFNTIAQQAELLKGRENNPVQIDDENSEEIKTLTL